MHETYGKYSGPLFLFPDIAEQSGHRFDGRRIESDHAAIEDRGHRHDKPCFPAHADIVEFFRAGDEIAVGIFLHQDNGVCIRYHHLRQMAVRIELHADGEIRPADTAQMRNEIALAIVASGGHHSAVEDQKRNVERSVLSKIRKYPVAIPLIDALQRRSGRLCRSNQSRNELVPVFGGFLLQALNDLGIGVAAIVVGRNLDESARARRPWRKGVRFRRKRRREDPHHKIPFISDAGNSVRGTSAVPNRRQTSSEDDANRPRSFRKRRHRPSSPDSQLPFPASLPPIPTCNRLPCNISLT